MALHTPSCSAAVLALALSIPLSIHAQESTGDPFLDAMINDQQEAQKQEQPSPAAPKAAEQKTPAPTAQKEAAREPEAPQATPETKLVSLADQTTLLDDSVLRRELGPDSGVFFNDSALEGKTIKNISVQSLRGASAIPTKRITDVIQSRVGSKYIGTRVNSDLERLIERGLVSGDARVAVSENGDGVNVIFQVTPANVLGGVGFSGNRRFNERKLREYCKLQSGKPVNDKDLSKARAEIIKAYQEAGYPDTRVSWSSKRTAQNGYEDVYFHINEGREVSMNDISFVGNTQFDENQLKQLLQTKERGLFTWITKSGRINREQLEDDLQAIVRHYRNYGYLRARIAKVEYFDNGKTSGRQKLRMRVHVAEGPRYHVRHVSFGKLSVYTPQQLEPGLSMLDGDIYSLKKVSDDVTMIRKYYGAKGYADADVRPDISEFTRQGKNGVEHFVDIRYDVNEGNRYLVGRINVRGNTKTRQNVILRELPLKPGENLNSVDLDIAKKRLDNLGYFDMVEVSQGLSRSSGYRDININVHEKMTGSLTFGVAFSSVENAYLYTTITQSNFDIRGLYTGCFVGGGQRLTLQGKLGTEFQSASLYLLEPWFLDRKLALGNELYFSNSSYMSDYYRQENYGYAVSLRRAISDNASIKAEYRIENYKLTEENDAPIFFRENSGNFTRSHLELSYNYDSRDAMITPRKGGSFGLNVGYSGPGSTVETYNAGISGSYYYNSFWDSIFSINFAMETVDSVQSDKEVPLFERCYLGGPQNLRGFRYHDVGMVDPKLAGDETMGGKSSAFAQLELTLPLFETMRFAIFMDGGFVHKNSFDFQLNEFAADYGIGLRINLPMGPLAVDYAIPFKTDNTADDSPQFQFYVDYKY